MNIAAWFSSITTNYSWVMRVVIVLAVTVLLYFVETIAYRHIVKHFEKTKRMWDDLLLHTLHPPLVFLIWLIGLTAAANIIKASSTAFKILDTNETIRQIGLIFLWCGLLYDLLGNLVNDWCIPLIANTRWIKQQSI